MGFFDGTSNMALVAGYDRNIKKQRNTPEKRSEQVIALDEATCRSALKAAGGKYSFNDVAGVTNIIIRPDLIKGKTVSVPHDTEIYKELLADLTKQREDLLEGMLLVWNTVGHAPNMADFYSLRSSGVKGVPDPQFLYSKFGSYFEALKACQAYKAKKDEARAESIKNL